jgi:hypothetical protein
MCWSVTPSSADCEISFFLLSNFARIRERENANIYLLTRSVLRVFLQTFKAKQGRGKSDISGNVEVFNRRISTRFPKVALDCDFDLSRYCPTREFYSDLHCLETFLIVFKIHVLCWTKIYRLFRFHVATHHCPSNYVLWGGYSVRLHSYKRNVFIFRIWFVVESFITMHSVNIVLGHEIKNT